MDLDEVGRVLLRGRGELAPRYPLMARDDHAVFPVPERGVTFVWDADPGRLDALVRRTRGYLAPYTVGMTREGEHWASRPWVAGREATRWEEIADVIVRLHHESPRRAGVLDVDAFYRQRCLRRLAGTEWYDMVASWRGWDELDGPWGAWHGDASLANCIVTPGGRVVLIDHAPQPEGPQLYDEAKALRHGVITNDMQIVGATSNPHVAAVVALMLGTHRHPALAEAFKLCTWGRR